MNVENPSYYIGDDDEAYCIEYGHDTGPIDSRYGCRYCPPEVDVTPNP